MQENAGRTGPCLREDERRMTLNQLRNVIAIADTGSMNEAAKKLYIAQPSLSQSIKELEKEIGAELFRRGNRGVFLTVEGEEFLSYARQVVQLI